MAKRRSPAKQAPVERPVGRRLAMGLALTGTVLALFLIGWWISRPRDSGQSRVINKASQNPGRSSLEDAGDQEVFSTYAGSESCRQCHEEEFNLWRTSHHALAE